VGGGESDHCTMTEAVRQVDTDPDWGPATVSYGGWGGVGPRRGVLSGKSLTGAALGIKQLFIILRAGVGGDSISRRKRERGNRFKSLRGKAGDGWGGSTRKGKGGRALGIGVGA